MAVLGTSTAVEITPGADLTIIVSRYAGTQLLTLTGGATGGTFTLTYRGVPTAAIVYNANGAAVQAALEAISSIKLGNVTVSGSAGGPWTVTPQGQLKVTDFLQNLITGTLTGLTGGSGYHLAVETPLLDVSTGYSYVMQARKAAGSAIADIYIDSTGAANPGTSIVQGSIDLTGGAAGHVKLLVNHTATAALDFQTGGPTTPGTAHWVLMETHSGDRTALIEDAVFNLKGKYFV